MNQQSSAPDESTQVLQFEYRTADGQHIGLCRNLRGDPMVALIGEQRMRLVALADFAHERRAAAHRLRAAALDRWLQALWRGTRGLGCACVASISTCARRPSTRVGEVA